MGVVLFDYAWWAAAYPELAPSVTQPMAANYFVQATLYCDNTDNSPIVDASVGGQRQVLLGMLTAHIAKLNSTENGVAVSDLVGRISSASEGSVSVSTDYQPDQGADWYNQTKYGAAFWAATVQYRLGRYIPGCPRFYQPPGPRFLWPS